MSSNTDNPLHSHHIFLFPFKWDYLPKGRKLKEVPFEERTSIDKFLQALNGLSWENSAFKIQLDDDDRYHTFNEYNYFHGYVRDALAITLNEQETTHRFRYRLPKNGQDAFFEISIKNKDKDAANSNYQLIIKDILLTTYDIGIGFLAFFLENRQTAEPADILRINDFGRRIYPQYLGYKSDDQKDSKFTDAPKGSFLADKIKLIGLSEKTIEEDFSDYERIEHLNGEPFKLPSHISKLLGSEFVISTRVSSQNSSKNRILLSPLVDDRMYVQCYYFAPTFMRKLRRYNEQKNKYSYIKNDFWYSYLFIDPSLSPTCTSRPMKEQLLEKHTYDRWLEYKNSSGQYESQLFGVSRYSFMTLVERSWFTENILINHHKFLYFQMMALALMQRAAILRFAEEAANVSEVIKMNKNASYQKRVIREIYRGYLYFTNKIYFREITPQEQGIELYDKMREVMEIDTDLTALQQEIAELHQYAVLLEGEKNSKESERLTWIATIFLPVTVVAAFFGFSNFPGNYPLIPSYLLAIGISFVLISILICTVLLLRFFRKS